MNVSGRLVAFRYGSATTYVRPASIWPEIPTDRMRGESSNCTETYPHFPSLCQNPKGPFKGSKGDLLFVEPAYANALAQGSFVEKKPNPLSSTLLNIPLPSLASLSKPVLGE